MVQNNSWDGLDVLNNLWHPYRGAFLTIRKTPDSISHLPVFHFSRGYCSFCPYWGPVFDPHRIDDLRFISEVITILIFKSKELRLQTPQT